MPRAIIIAWMASWSSDGTAMVGLEFDEADRKRGRDDQKISKAKELSPRIPNANWLGIAATSVSRQPRSKPMLKRCCLNGGFVRRNNSFSPSRHRHASGCLTPRRDFAAGA